MGSHRAATSIISALSMLGVLACQPEQTVPVDIVYGTQAGGDSDTGDSHLGGDSNQGLVPWWNTAWQYRRQITVSASDALVAGFTLRLDLDHHALVTVGDSLSSGDDVRIVRYNNATWTDQNRFASFPPFDYATAPSAIWFRNQSAIAAGTTDQQYWLYYGNDFAVSPPEDANQVVLYNSSFPSGALSSWDTYAVSQAFTYTAAGRLCKNGSTTAQHASQPYINDKLVLSTVNAVLGARVVFYYTPPDASTPLSDGLFAVGLCSASTDNDGFYVGITGGGDWFTDTNTAGPAVGYFRSAGGGKTEASEFAPYAAFDATQEIIIAASWTASQTTISIDGTDVATWDEGPADTGRLCIVANSMADVCVRQLTARHYVDNDPTLTLGPVEQVP